MVISLGLTATFQVTVDDFQLVTLKVQTDCLSKHGPCGSLELRLCLFLLDTTLARRCLQPKIVI